MSDVLTLLAVCVDLHSIVSDSTCIIRGPIYLGYMSLQRGKLPLQLLTLLDGAEAEDIY